LVRKIQRDLLKTTRRSKTRSTSDSQEFRRRETDDDLSEDDIKFLFRNRPVLTAAMPKIKREHPGSSEPVTESHQPPFVGKDDRHLSSGRQESRGRESDDKSSSDETLFYDGPVRPTLSPRSSEPFLKTRSGNAAAPGNTQEQIRLGTLEETVKKLVEADKRSPEQATEKEVGGSSLSYPKNLHRTYDLPMVNGGMPPPHYYHEGLARVRKRGRPSKADLIARAALRDKADLIARATLRGGVDKSRSEQATGKEAGGSSLSRPKNQYQTNDPPMISRDILPKPPYPSLPLAGSVKKRGRPSKADAIARGDKVDKSSSEQATGKEAGGSSLSRTENQQLSNNPLRNVLDILPKPPNPPEALGGSARKRGRPSKADLIARTALRDKIDKSSPEQATEKEAGGSSLSRPKNQHQTNDPPMIHHGILPIPAFPPEAEALALAGSVWKRGRPSKADAIAHGDITPPPNA
jgi:hypothetical protein